MLKTLKTSFLGVAAMATSVTGASAGGLSDQIVEQPVVPDVMEAPAEASAPAWLIPVVILGALLVASSSGGSSCEKRSKGGKCLDDLLRVE